MGECFVRFCHLVCLLSFHGCTGVVHGIHISPASLSFMVRSLRFLRKSPTTASQRLSALGLTSIGNLIGRSADSSCFHFKTGMMLFNACSNASNGSLACFRPYDIKCTVHDFLCDALFAVDHDIVQQFSSP
jgi:hypothetical protein